MATLSIYLGSYNESTCEGSVSASSLTEAKSKVSLVPGSLATLTINVKGSELSSVWSNPMHLSSFAEALTEDARVVVNVKSPDESVSLKTLHTSFLLAGFVGTSEKKESDGSRVLTATRIPKQSLPKSAPLKPKTMNIKSTKITVNLNDDDDLINEENLLTDATNLLGAPPAMNMTSNKDDCSGREACENCTCGRSENKNIDTIPQKQNIETSACGKCGLGDAFRCASCPYLGKPAFKAGEERLVLDLQDDF